LAELWDKKIIGVEADSIAEEMGIEPGDSLISVNGNKIQDVFDYRLIEGDVDIEILKANGEEWLLETEIYEGEDIGLIFEDGLMDDVRSCANNCVFCFIHQNPRGIMRKTIYFKDDDYRLSFLHGNYITMTNMHQTDIDRILAHCLSPINISVHTTNALLRSKIMGNKRAGECLPYIEQLAQAGIDLGLQIVLCKGYNDGKELDKTITDLGHLMQYGVDLSLSVVPAGLTRHRDGLPSLQPFSESDCADIIRQVDAHQQRFLAEFGTRFVYCADEFYVRAKVTLPNYDVYEDFPQIENGVGMMAAFRREFEQAPRHDIKDRYTMVTGFAAYDFMQDVCRGLPIDIVAIRNDFFGESVTVAGLITGGDIIKQLKGRNLGTLLIPSNMLRAGEEIFLDDVCLADVSRELGINVLTLHPNGDFIQGLS